MTCAISHKRLVWEVRRGCGTEQGHLIPQREQVKMFVALMYNVRTPRR